MKLENQKSMEDSFNHHTIHTIPSHFVFFFSSLIFQAIFNPKHVIVIYSKNFTLQNTHMYLEFNDSESIQIQIPSTPKLS